MMPHADVITEVMHIHSLRPSRTLGGMGGLYGAGGFAGRSGSTRKKMLAEGGGSSASGGALR